VSLTRQLPPIALVRMLHSRMLVCSCDARVSSGTVRPARNPSVLLPMATALERSSRRSRGRVALIPDLLPRDDLLDDRRLSAARCTTESRSDMLDTSSRCSCKNQWRNYLSTCAAVPRHARRPRYQRLRGSRVRRPVLRHERVCDGLVQRHRAPFRERVLQARALDVRAYLR
jgi:hypothetical protein